jgi:formylmethanofuran dehydrogenase subunit E
MAKSGCIQCDRLRRELADAYAQRDKAIQAASDLRNAQNYGELLRENTRLLEELVNMKKGKPPVAAPPDAMVKCARCGEDVVVWFNGADKDELGRPVCPNCIREGERG